MLHADARRPRPRHAAPRHGSFPTDDDGSAGRPQPNLAAFAPAAVAERIERAPSLDRAVRSLSDAAVRALPTGRRTDALHGVPFGQPAHPALVRLPLGCWTSAVLLDFFPSARRASTTLITAGLLTSLPSAATGLADWSALHRHQQRVGIVHAAWQLGAVSLFGMSLLARTAGWGTDGRVLAAAGVVAATAGAYLGGHLALRLGAGASHAEAVGHLADLGWHDLCRLRDLPDGHPVRRQLGYLSLLAVRHDETVSVLSDHCAHLGGPLHQGRVIAEKGESCVSCPWHGSTFRLSDGAVVHGPATARQPAFESRITGDGTVQVRPRLGAGARHEAA
ncbi:MAG: Rieske 2Fe-2S domain-containing protein [Streptosporangiales bacterium]|nr:Rieske 2Fe-2S domain-containing protein [Streptosporangiales bacterium]